MATEKTYDELKAENAELKELLSKVIKANDLMSEELRTYRESTGKKYGDAKVSSAADVKNLLKKYSRL